MTEPGDEFETFLRTRTVLPSGMSDDDKLEPPKALDAIVLKKAREAIRARQRLNRTPRWAMPVALAATILLCLSVVLNVGLNTNRPTANLRRMTAATADNTSPTPSSPASEAKRRENVAGGISSDEAILPEEKVAEPRAPRPQVLAETATPAPDASLGANGSAIDKADALGNRSRTPAQAPSDAPSAPAPSAAARSAPPSGTASSPAAAPASPPPSGSVAEAQPGDQPALAKRKAAATPPPHPQDPKTWLQQIAALRAEGKTAQADAEMQRFRATFPAYPAKPDPSAPSEPPK
jgi:hypothetical protein